MGVETAKTNSHMYSRREVSMGVSTGGAHEWPRRDLRSGTLWEGDLPSGSQLTCTVSVICHSYSEYMSQ